jgi:hypothetical protein
MIDRQLATGDWIRLAPGVYALAACAPTWQRQYKAAELSVPGSAISDLSAAWLLGFDGFRLAGPELVARHSCNHRNQLAVVHRSIDVRTTIALRITVTTPAQTLVDLVRRVRLDRWERAADAQLLSRKMTADELAERVTAYERSRRPGIAALRALALERSEDRAAAAESELEVLLHRAVALAPSCPPVVWQAPLPWSKAGEGRVDGLIPTWGVVLEADGRRWHAPVRDFDADRWRDNRAAAVGLRVLRFTWVHLTQRLDEVVDIIEQAGRASRQVA